ncbi:uncharacterized protein FIBRA_01940 [Fibroporia radiculosa]|uniref:Uncharacterized protein n=1 Tax=Fibroporia radiculosa TaxID=599839 RepID=J4GLX2_9APHY|nr:uncharacterized protein FIBRA_01940 [Fibroporia radiculosa]CCL99915.1 predicted protein [Fibroporia radiculosa]
MSDEYASSGFQGSLVNDSLQTSRGEGTYETGNYPPPGDTTSSGGYSSRNTWTNRSQRGHLENMSGSAEAGLLDQSVTGGPIGDEIEDAKQGQDELSRKNFHHEAIRDFGGPSIGITEGLNPYGRNIDSKDEAAQMLSSSHNDARGRRFESEPAASNDADAGAV